MGKYNILVAPAFKREFKKLPRKVQKKVITCLEGMTTDPRPPNVEKLSQDPRFWRARIGNYRMIYAIEDEQNIVIACLVRHRRDAYRDIDKLDARLVLETLKPLLAGIHAESPPPP
jgi:mRNA interferase RelE/StbE